MEKENYTLKEIILGTRREYRKLNDYLYVLKALTTCYDKNVQDYCFKLSAFNGKKPELLWQFIQNPRTLKGIIYYLQKSIYGFKDTPEYKMLLKNDGNERLIVNAEYDVSVNNELMQYFEQIVGLIISSDFANKMNFRLHTLPNLQGSIIISPDIITLSCIENQHDTSLYYYPHADFIKLHYGNEEILNVSLLKNILNKQIPAETLSSYHRDLIDGNSAVLKPVKACLGEQGNFTPMTRIRIKEFDKGILLSAQNQ